VSGLTDVTAIAAGFDHGLALLSNGTVMAWGDNSYGELGNGTTTNSDIPVPVSGLSGVTAVTAGGDDSLALLDDGTVVAWGDNSYGELGNGTTTSSDSPVAVSGLSGVTAVSAGLEHALALVSGGRVMAWGNDDAGQLGDGSTDGISETPVAVTGLTGSTVTAVSAGLDHSLGLLSDGTVVAWGDNGAGELGNASEVNSDTPVVVSDLANVTAISAGSNFSLALSSTEHVYSWGLDATTQSDVPVEVRGISGITAVSAGGDHSVAVRGQNPVAPGIRHRAAASGQATETHASNVRLARSTTSRVLRPTRPRAGLHRALSRR
jgi:alpha-tubulin suppressor-like RCC1 family protein